VPCPYQRVAFQQMGGLFASGSAAWASAHMATVRLLSIVCCSTGGQTVVFLLSWSAFCRGCKTPLDTFSVVGVCLSFSMSAGCLLQGKHTWLVAHVLVCMAFVNRAAVQRVTQHLVLQHAFLSSDRVIKVCSRMVSVDQSPAGSFCLGLLC
jgi:hypothetical protein